jgi:hypothetical protein
VTAPKVKRRSQALWFRPVTPATQEVRRGESQFEASLRKVMKTLSQKQAGFAAGMPIILATQEAELE